MKNLWEINAERHKTIHPTEKPETLMQRIILIASKEGDTVLDPFTGSGTTGAVAKKLNRNFIGIEISKEYFDIATHRINVQENDELNFNVYLNGNNNNAQQLLLMEDKAKYSKKKKEKAII